MAHRIARWLGMAALVVGYSVLAHYTSESAHHRQLGAVVAIAPVVALAALLAWRSPQRAAMVAALLLLCGALWLSWPLLQSHFAVIYWLQHVGMQLILLALFGRTLLPGQLPLCTRFARAVHAPLVLSAAHESYTRHVTLAWTLFFALMALASTALFVLFPLATWSVFANFLTLPLVVLMFVAEYLIRQRALPHAPRTHILDAVRAFRNSAGQN